MANEGTVNEIGQTQKGTPKVKIDGHWYIAGGQTRIDGLAVGDRVSFDSVQSKNAPNVYFLNKWGKIGSVAPAPKTQNGNGHDKPSAVSGDAEQRFITGVCIQAIQAGHIKAPSEIAEWVIGAKRALAYGAGYELPRAEEPEGDIPF